MIKTTKIFFLFFLLGANQIVWGQGNLGMDKDSLIREIENLELADSFRINAYYALALHHIYKSPDIAEDYVTQGLSMSESISYIDGMGQGYAWMAYINTDKGNIKEAIDFNLKSLAIVQQQKLVLEYPVILNNLGALHLKLNNDNKAIHYFKECATINIKFGNQKSLATNYYNIGIAHNNLSEPIKAKEYYNRAIDIRLEIGDEKGLSNSYSSLGNMLEKIDSFDIALKYYQKALVLKEKYELNKGTSMILLKIGNVQLSRGNITEAYLAGTRAHEIAEKWDFRYELKESAKVLYKINRAKNKYKEALFYYEEYVVLHDSMHSLENHNSVIRSEFEFEYNKKHLIDSLEKDKIRIKNQLLNEENKVKENQLSLQRLWLTVSILLIFILIIILFFLRKNARIRMENLRTEIKLRHIETLGLKDELAIKGEQSSISNQGLNIVLHDKLTSREQEILDALVLGLSNKEIGEKLFLSVNTIKTHINNLYAKLDVRNRTQAAVKGSLLKIQENS